jgi:hypothetical protein
VKETVGFDGESVALAGVVAAEAAVASRVARNTVRKTFIGFSLSVGGLGGLLPDHGC